MEELEYIKNERLKLQEEYFKSSKNIWLEFEGIEDPLLAVEISAENLKRMIADLER